MIFGTFVLQLYVFSDGLLSNYQNGIYLSRAMKQLAQNRDEDASREAIQDEDLII